MNRQTFAVVPSKIVSKTSLKKWLHCENALCCKTSRGNHLLHWITISTLLNKPCKLANVTCATQALEFQELLIAKLLGIIRLCPLFPNIQECKVIPSWTHKILPSLISMQFFLNGDRTTILIQRASIY